MSIRTIDPPKATWDETWIERGLVVWVSVALTAAFVAGCAWIVLVHYGVIDVPERCPVSSHYQGDIHLTLEGLHDGDRVYDENGYVIAYLVAP